jgi:hypothetical protein
MGQCVHDVIIEFFGQREKDFKAPIEDGTV